jgi:hypothetical protein
MKIPHASVQMLTLGPDPAAPELPLFPMIGVDGQEGQSTPEVKVSFAHSTIKTLVLVNFEVCWAGYRLCRKGGLG